MHIIATFLNDWISGLNGSPGVIRTRERPIKDDAKTLRRLTDDDPCQGMMRRPVETSVLSRSFLTGEEREGGNTSCLGAKMIGVGAPRLTLQKCGLQMSFNLLRIYSPSGNLLLSTCNAAVLENVLRVQITDCCTREQ